MKILIVDPATSGCAGTYLNGIYTLIDNKSNVKIAANYYFPFDYGIKIFYKYSELSAQGKYKLGKFRLYIRFLELTIALIRLIIYIIKNRISITCYALSSNLFIEYIFFFIIKHFTKSKVWIICHDVIPFSAPNAYNQEVKKRAKFYKVAHKLIVHNKNSIQDLETTFGVSGQNIKFFPFPIMDMNALPEANNKSSVISETNGIRFLFIGHLRHEKGINLLLSAWQKLSSVNMKAQLIVAGNIPKNYNLIIPQNISNLKFVSKYLCDEDYISLIRSADFIIYPYLRGTNSGVIYTAASLGKLPIVSDIEMFRNIPFIMSSCFFTRNDEDDLIRKLSYFAEMKREDITILEMQQLVLYKKYEASLKTQINQCFWGTDRTG